MALAFTIVLLANPIYMPALLLCQLHANDFRISNYGTMDYWVSRFEEVNLFIGGFPVTTNYVILIAMLLRIVHEMARHTSRLRAACPLWMVLLWLLSIVPATMISADAFYNRLPSWTLSVRMALMIGGYFYGAILASRWSDKMEFVWMRMLMVTIGLMFSGFLGLFWARALFVLDAFGPTLGYVAFRRNHKLLGAAAIAATLLYVSGSGQQEAAFRTNGNVSTTVTLIVTSIAALMLIVVFYKPPKRPSLLLGAAGALAIISVTGMLPIVAGYTYRERRTEEQCGENKPLADLENYKIFNERAPIWKGAIDKITSPPYLLPKAGDPLIVDWGGRSMMVGFGSHNAYLDQMRVNGWLTGLFGVAVMASALGAAWFSLQFEINPYFRALAAAILALGVISATANHFLTEVSAGLWYFVPAGMVFARLRLMRKRNLSAGIGAGGGANQAAGISEEFRPS